MKIIRSLIPLLMAAALMTSCSNEGLVESVSKKTTLNTQSVKTSGKISLNGDSAVTDNSNVLVNGSKITIMSAGEYEVSGLLKDGQIIIDSKDENTVTLVLNGVDITCSNSAPIYVKKAGEVVIKTVGETENIIRDAKGYIFEADTDEPYAAIFSKDDLVITGDGLLKVYGVYRNGITGKDSLKIKGGTIYVEAENDGIRGRDSVEIADADITIISKGDGIQSNNDEDHEKGYVNIISGSFDITSGGDAIAAQTDLKITEGSFKIITLKNDKNDSMKGLKASNDIYIDGGTFDLNTFDDSIHSNNLIIINDGNFTIESEDDGIHADKEIIINSGTIDILKSYEGIESSSIVINGANIRIISSDDGINGAGGNDGSAFTGRGPKSFGSATSGKLVINGGYININSLGDGLDVNGNIEMNGGIVVISGPVDSRNGAIDYDGSFIITAGELIAAGSAGMPQAPGNGSTQKSIMISTGSTVRAGTLFGITTQDSEVLAGFIPEKNYQLIVYSSPKLKQSEEYNVYIDGKIDGKNIDGYFSEGTLSGGSLLVSIKITETVSGNVTGQGGFRPQAPGR